MTEPPRTAPQQRAAKRPGQGLRDAILGGAGTPSSRRRVLSAGVLALWLLPIAAMAAPVPPAAILTPQDNLELQRVAAYLNGIKTMTARFQQTAANGAVSYGHMWVARPGRMRFEYDPPNPILLIADTFYVYYFDRELNQMQQVGLKSTPAWFLLRDPVSFGPDVVVTRFEHAGNLIRISVVERAQPDQGSLTMVFTETPLALRQWTVLDQQGKTTTVSLSDMQFGMALDPKLFQYQDPYAAGRREGSSN
ncbi:MAG: outer membrane lipoprotein carrier protein LolA [Alphaproteobacteria bacterium]|nr:outer membrane lipoprotein carrier protein LolA [Alphaproteobacteria bacterium]